MTGLSCYHDNIKSTDAAACYVEKLYCPKLGRLSLKAAHISDTKQSTLEPEKKI
jgi:hypothetical protein